jgi:SAM-dependent methyltransferase
VGETAPEHPQWLQRLHKARDGVVPWIERTVPLAGRTVLEYGCGQGAISCAIAARAGRHIGIDIAAGEIALAREHTARRGLHDVELVAVREDEILERVAAYRGQIDVFLLYAVLEHLSPDERLAILRLARETVSPDGHIVVCETPNRLTPIDHHTGQMPFLHLLPQALAARYYDRSRREDFVRAIDAAATDGPAAVRQALVRWGTGVSFHEFELVFDDLAAHTVASSYHPLLYPSRPVRGEELQLAATLAAWRPELPPCWSRSWLDTILSARAQAQPAVHVRPWQMMLAHDVAGAAMLADGRVELRPGARLPVCLPSPTGELHVGLMAAEPARALRIHVPGAILSPTAVGNLDGVPPWHAVAELPEPADALELSLPGGGCLTYVGHRGPPDPLASRMRAGGW